MTTNEGRAAPTVTQAEPLLRARPFYRSWAADDMANVQWYGLNAGERGLLHSMAHGCWVNGSVPRDPRLLARAIRLDEADVVTNFTLAVVRHFTPDPFNDAMLRLPEIDRQLAEIMATRATQSAGGRLGAAMTNRAKPSKPVNREVKDSMSGIPASQPAPVPAGTPAGQVRVSDTTRHDTNRTEQPLELDLRPAVELRADVEPELRPAADPRPADPWVADYTAAEHIETTASVYAPASRRVACTAEDYRLASRG